VTVRPVESRDAAGWAALRARLWPDADARALTIEANAFLAGEAPPTVGAAFVAEHTSGDDPALCGFIELAIRPFSDGCDSMPVPHVEGWYVEPALRGAGLGRRLMACAEAWARARGFCELASDTEVENRASLLAHQACGFQEVDRLVKLRKGLD